MHRLRCACGQCIVGVKVAAGQTRLNAIAETGRHGKRWVCWVVCHSLACMSMATTSLDTRGPCWPDPVLGSEIREGISVSLGKSHYGLSTLQT